MFDRIWACIFAFLLSIFPSLDRYSPALDWKAATNTVLTAVQAGDINTIEAFMCKNIKDNTPDLRGEIGKLINAIQGNITSTSTKFYDDYSAASGGSTVMRSRSVIQMVTPAGDYWLYIVWEYYNNYSFAARGIRDIYLGFGAPGEGEILVEIQVT